jgi:hypothetical protein
MHSILVVAQDMMKLNTAVLEVHIPSVLSSCVSYQSAGGWGSSKAQVIRLLSCGYLILGVLLWIVGDFKKIDSDGDIWKGSMR